MSTKAKIILAQIIISDEIEFFPIIIICYTKLFHVKHIL